MWIAECQCGWQWKDREELGARLAIYWHMLDEHRRNKENHEREVDKVSFTVEWEFGNGPFSTRLR